MQVQINDSVGLQHAAISKVGATGPVNATTFDIHNARTAAAGGTQGAQSDGSNDALHAGDNDMVSKNGIWSE